MSLTFREQVSRYIFHRAHGSADPPCGRFQFPPGLRDTTIFLRHAAEDRAAVAHEVMALLEGLQLANPAESLAAPDAGTRLAVFAEGLPAAGATGPHAPVRRRTTPSERCDVRGGTPRSGQVRPSVGRRGGFRPRQWSRSQGRRRLVPTTGGGGTGPLFGGEPLEGGLHLVEGAVHLRSRGARSGSGRRSVLRTGNTGSSRAPRRNSPGRRYPTWDAGRSFVILGHRGGW